MSDWINSWFKSDIKIRACRTEFFICDHHFSPILLKEGFVLWVESIYSWGVPQYFYIKYLSHSYLLLSKIFHIFERVMSQINILNCDRLSFRRFQREYFFHFPMTAIPWLLTWLFTCSFFLLAWFDVNIQETGSLCWLRKNYIFLFHFLQLLLLGTFIFILHFLLLLCLFLATCIVKFIEKVYGRVVG